MAATTYLGRFVCTNLSCAIRVEFVPIFQITVGPDEVCLIIASDKVGTQPRAERVREIKGGHNEQPCRVTDHNPTSFTQDIKCIAPVHVK
jgi:hypothetical protein